MAMKCQRKGCHQRWLLENEGGQSQAQGSNFVENVISLCGKKPADVGAKFGKKARPYLNMESRRGVRGKGEKSSGTEEKGPPIGHL